MTNETNADLNMCCSFTGHRPQKFPWKYDEKDERCIALKAVLTEQIEALAAVGVTEFYTGMALGTDYLGGYGGPCFTEEKFCGAVALYSPV